MAAKRRRTLCARQHRAGAAAALSELNPTENVWHYLRANKLSARVRDSFDAIVQASAEAWNWFAADPDRIKSIGTRDWATVNI